MGIVVNAPFPRSHRIVNVVRNTFRHLFLDAFRNWMRNLAATAPALGSMTLLLLLSGLVGLTAYAVQRLAAAQASEAAVLHVYLRDDAKPEDVSALRARLTADHRVAGVSLTSKADALKRAQHRPGMADLAGAVDDNPFPASLDVSVRSVSDVGPLSNAVSNSPPVDPILPTSYNAGANDRIQKALLIAGIAGGAFLLLLGFVAITVTANSIRAAILTRRDEVSIMQLVGAPRWMVRGPFVVEGALTGGIAGLAASVVTLVIGVAVVAAGRSTFAQIAPGVSIGACVVAAAIVLMAGLLLGSAASLLSVHRQLET
ncbi:MAG TPA: permease-like cell division protein FtsX [Candidatus Dormibacteraeota bacterium]|nr:permease-like cell division protein FtsX [Candidatus Dormibacteraeota bacterium]